MNYSWLLLLGLRRRVFFVIIAGKGLLYWERSPWVSALDTVSLREEAQLAVKFVCTQEIPSLVAWQNYREEMAVVLGQITPFGSIFSRQEQNRTSVVGCMQGFWNNFIYSARIWVFSPICFFVVLSKFRVVYLHDCSPWKRVEGDWVDEPWCHRPRRHLLTELKYCFSKMSFSRPFLFKHV